MPKQISKIGSNESFLHVTRFTLAGVIIMQSFEQDNWFVCEWCLEMVKVFGGNEE